MCNFGAREECRNRRIFISSYLDVEISNDQYRMVNPTPLDCIEGFITEDDIVDKYSNRLP